MIQDSQLQRQQLRLEIARIRRRLDARLRSGSEAPLLSLFGQTQRGSSFWSSVGLAAVSIVVMLATRRGRSELPKALPRILADLAAAWFNRPAPRDGAGESKV